jgi:hypothetical protein
MPVGIACGNTCSATFPAGTLLELTATPDSNARIVGWSAPCASASEECSIMVAQDLAITVEFELYPPIVSNGQPATLVLGQGDLDSAYPSTIPAANVLRFARQCASDGSRLWVSDDGFNRVLQWDAEPLVTQTAATLAIGQPNLTSNQDGHSDSLGIFRDVASDGQRLFALGLNRVLIFSTLPSSSGQAATLVIGQSDFTSSIVGTTASRLSGPRGIHVSGGRLFVADSSNNRVLIWNSIPTTSGLHPADVVLGQPDFTSFMTPDPPSAASLNYPYDVFHDPISDKLIVADSNNHRVLVWNSVPSMNGAPADLVLGQNSFSLDTPNLGAMTPSAFGMFQPLAVTVAHDALFVADYGNQRVLIWRPIPESTMGAPADFVLGRTRFDDGSDPSITASAIGYTSGLCVIGNSLFVVSYDLHRATRFELTP